MRVFRSVAAALVATEVLAGCVATPPPGPTDADVDAYNELMLQRTWDGFPFDDSIERPQVVQQGALPHGKFFDAAFSCLSERGFDGYSMGYSPDEGFTLGDGDGTAVGDPQILLAFYRCVATHPPDFRANHELLTTAQIDYIYDYYVRWVYPCMAEHGYTVADAPTRADFHANAGLWNPYIVVMSGPNAEKRYNDLAAECGDYRPPLG